MVVMSRLRPHLRRLRPRATGVACRTLSSSGTVRPKLQDGPGLEHFLGQLCQSYDIIVVTTNEMSLIVAGGASGAAGSAPLMPPRHRRKTEPKPKWLKVEPVDSENYQRLRDTVRSLGLSTVCEEAKCPNIGECWGGKEGTGPSATVSLSSIEPFASL